MNMVIFLNVFLIVKWKDSVIWILFLKIGKFVVIINLSGREMIWVIVKGWKEIEYRGGFLGKILDGIVWMEDFFCRSKVFIMF